MNNKQEPGGSILIIGGTSAYHLDLEKYGRIKRTERYSTVAGISSEVVQIITPTGDSIYFISRHGLKSLAFIPSSVNYAANIEAAKLLNIKWVFSWNGVGAINRLLKVNDLVIPSALADFTKTRNVTVFPNLIYPFDERGRVFLFQAAKSNKKRVFPGTYVCTEGPHLETKGEIDLFSRYRIDIVGMTLSPEAWLASQAGMAYASLAIVTNLATGIEIENRKSTDFSKYVGELGMKICLEAANFIK
jgi:5'-methylthioadenosine phosphorylase